MHDVLHRSRICTCWIYFCSTSCERDEHTGAGPNPPCTWNGPVIRKLGRCWTGIGLPTKPTQQNGNADTNAKGSRGMLLQIDQSVLDFDFDCACTGIAGYFRVRRRSVRETVLRSAKRAQVLALSKVHPPHPCTQMSLSGSSFMPNASQHGCAGGTRLDRTAAMQQTTGVGT